VDLDNRDRRAASVEEPAGVSDDQVGELAPLEVVIGGAAGVVLIDRRR
jgi:hypothetical protein